jgi:tripartite-type tricarboxylate transporter receptor subunit TctC
LPRRHSSLPLLAAGLLLAAALPAAIAERQAALVRDAMRDPALAPRLADLGVEPVASSPAELGRIFRDELAATRAIVARTGIEME